MFLTKESAKSVLRSSKPEADDLDINYFVDMLYGKSQERDMGDVLIQFFEYWEWAGLGV